MTSDSTQINNDPSRVMAHRGMLSRKPTSSMMVMSRQKMTIFAILGGVRRCGGQAFFDKLLSICNCIAAFSYMSRKQMERRRL